MIKIDDKEVQRHLALLGKMSAGMARKVCARHVNGLAFATKRHSATTLEQFKYRNASAKTFTLRGVYVDKARASGEIQSQVGAVGNPSGTSRKAQRVAYLQRQEQGGKVSQLKAAGGQFRKILVAPDPRANKGKLTPRLTGRAAYPNAALAQKFQRRSSRFVRRLKFRTRDRILFASAIAAAKQEGKPYAITPYGVYRVQKRKVNRVQAFKRSISTSPRPWLAPAREMAVREEGAIFIREMTRTMKEAGFATA